MTTELTAAGGGGGTPLWATFLIAAVPLAVAIYTGFLAARAQRLAQQAETERERLRLLEQRIANRKLETYTPIIALLRDMLDPRTASTLDTVEMVATLGEFGSWLSVVGSDEAIHTFSRFMQGAYSSAPVPVLLRLYSDFLLATRRDLGDPDTRVDTAAVLGIRLKDLYTGDPGLHLAMTLPFAELCRRAEWAPPWDVAPSGASQYFTADNKAAQQAD